MCGSGVAVGIDSLIFLCRYIYHDLSQNPPLRQENKKKNKKKPLPSSSLLHHSLPCLTKPLSIHSALAPLPNRNHVVPPECWSLRHTDRCCHLALNLLKRAASNWNRLSSSHESLDCWTPPGLLSWNHTCNLTVQRNKDRNRNNNSIWFLFSYRHRCIRWKYILITNEIRERFVWTWNPNNGVSSKPALLVYSHWMNKP